MVSGREHMTESNGEWKRTCEGECNCEWEREHMRESVMVSREERISGRV